MSESVVSLAGIRSQGRHGANPGERDEWQEFVVDVQATIDVGEDSLDETVDYAALADAARSVVTDQSFELLETLAAAVAEAVFQFERVTQAVATVRKPAAAAALGTDEVSAQAVVS